VRYGLPGAYVLELLALVEDARGSTDRLLAGLPIDRAALADPLTVVPLRVCEALVARASELTSIRALGLQLGLRMKLSSHGFLGFAAMTADNVREALELAARFASTRTSAISLSLHVEGELASIEIAERAPLGALREVIVLALVIGLAQLGQRLTGRVLDGVGECAFAEPDYVRGTPFHGRLRFARPTHRLVFPARELALPITSADPSAKRLAADQLERELAALREAELIAKVRALLANGDDAIGIDAMARALRMAPRTLKRRLAELGTTYSTLRDSQRRARALLLLDERALSISEVADRLGYTELPNFTRAFRRWTGMSPAAYRAQVARDR